MTAAQKIMLRRSAVRERLAELAGLEGEDFTPEARSEAKALQREYGDLEVRYRSAILAEPEPRERDTTGEGAELRGLARRARLAEYLSAVVDGRSVEGAEAELREAYGIKDSNAVPWAALAHAESDQDAGGPVEYRADAITPAPSTVHTSQDPIMPRVFPRSVMEFLGVRMPRVPVGQKSYPVLTSGQTAKTLAKSGKVESAAGTFSVLSLGPKRITARFSFAVEDAAVLRGMEEALRRDLSAVLADGIEAAILTGNGTAPNVTGFFSALTAPDSPTGNETYARYVRGMAEYIDGKHASTIAEVRALVGPETGKDMHLVFQGDTGYSAWEALARMSGGLRVSAHVPAAVGNVQNNLMRRGNTQPAVAPIWEGVRLIRDEITSAASGEVHITAVGLYSFGLARKDEYGINRYRLTP